MSFSIAEACPGWFVLFFHIHLGSRSRILPAWLASVYCFPTAIHTTWAAPTLAWSLLTVRLTVRLTVLGIFSRVFLQHIPHLTRDLWTIFSILVDSELGWTEQTVLGLLLRGRRGRGGGGSTFLAGLPFLGRPRPFSGRALFFFFFFLSLSPSLSPLFLDRLASRVPLVAGGLCFLRGAVFRGSRLPRTVAESIVVDE